MFLFVVEILQNLFFMRIRDPNQHTENEMQAGGIRRTQTFAGIHSNTNVKCKTFCMFFYKGYWYIK